MSKLVPNITDTARLFRGRDFVGKFSHGHYSICLTSRVLAFEVAKQQNRARFFADKSMIAHAGGPWLIQEFKDQLVARKDELRSNLLNLEIGNVESKDLFSYRTCPVDLILNHPTRPNPIALQIVQKAQVFAVADDILERLIEGL